MSAQELCAALKSCLRSCLSLIAAVLRHAGQRAGGPKAERGHNYRIKKGGRVMQFYFSILLHGRNTMEFPPPVRTGGLWHAGKFGLVVRVFVLNVWCLLR